MEPAAALPVAQPLESIVAEPMPIDAQNPIVIVYAIYGTHSPNNHPVCARCGQIFERTSQNPAAAGYYRCESCLGLSSCADGMCIVG